MDQVRANALDHNDGWRVGVANVIENAIDRGFTQPEPDDDDMHMGHAARLALPSKGAVAEANAKAATKQFGP